MVWKKQSKVQTISSSSDYSQSIWVYSPIWGRKWKSWKVATQLYPHKPVNLACLQLEHDNIDWWSCPISEVEEYMNTRSKRMTQRLKLPCQPAQEYMKKLYHERFPLNSLWVRRNEDTLKYGAYVVILGTANGKVQMQRWIKSRAMGAMDQWGWGREDTLFNDEPIKKKKGKKK